MGLAESMAIGKKNGGRSHRFKLRNKTFGRFDCFVATLSELRPEQNFIKPFTVPEPLMRQRPRRFQLIWNIRRRYVEK
jgi:hypothetical protein